MDEKLKISTSQTETIEAGVSPAHSRSAGKAPSSSTARSNEERKSAPADSPSGELKTDLALDLNKLQESSAEELETLARDLDVYLHPARSRHQQILDIIRAALASGSTVTAEGFLDQVGDSFAMLRWPRSMRSGVTGPRRNTNFNRPFSSTLIPPRLMMPTLSGISCR